MQAEFSWIIYLISMKLFNRIKEWFDNQEHLFSLFIFVLIVPNLVLCFTEPLPLVAKIANVLLPLACYYLVMTFSRNCGKMLWILFLFVFFGAFQIVLLYLFGQSIIAVDMFLNLATTNSSEAMELLDNLIPALVIIVVLYIPALILGMISIIRKRRLSVEFIRKERKRGWVLLVIGFISLGAAYGIDKKYELTSDLYPVNVCYNVYLAFDRDAKTRDYAVTSKDFTFHARATHPAEEKEIYMLVVGETSRALNWSLYGYGRETNPQLSKVPNVIAFTDVLTQSNTTHKSVPMLMSAVSAENFDSIYYQKGIITAFKEAGYKTAFFSNQRYNNSFIDFFGKEAESCDFIKEDSLDGNFNPSDDDLVEFVEKELNRGEQKLFIVLHTYGSHFNYRERYPAEAAFFQPDSPADAEVKYRDNLVNAYDNSVRYTDAFLSRLINLLDRANVKAAMLYTSDHGEDIFDDNRHLFLHASPVPSYYQLHVPFIVWTSDVYRQQSPAQVAALEQNRHKSVASNRAVFHSILNLAGIETSYRKDSLSVASEEYEEAPRFYLNDHNEPRSYKDIGLRKEDFEMFRKNKIKYE